MKILKTLISKFSFIAILSILTTPSAFAAGGTMNYSIGAIGVPTLSGSMLILLSLLLFVVAYRITKQKNASAGKFFITLVGVTALSMGAGGVKLISDAKAGFSTTPLNGSGSIVIPPNSSQAFINNFAEDVTILSITADPGSQCGVLTKPAARPETAAAPALSGCTAGLVMAQGDICFIACFAVMNGAKPANTQ